MPQFPPFRPSSPLPSEGVQTQILAELKAIRALLKPVTGDGNAIAAQSFGVVTSNGAPMQVVGQEGAELISFGAQLLERIEAATREVIDLQGAVQASQEALLGYLAVQQATL